MPFRSLADEPIQQFIHHDERRHHIYLFLRTTKGVGYTYLGELKYLWHDPQRERPVYFQWHILDWHIPPETLRRMGLAYSPSRPAGPAYSPSRPAGLQLRPAG